MFRIRSRTSPDQQIHHVHPVRRHENQKNVQQNYKIEMVQIFSLIEQERIEVSVMVGMTPIAYLALWRMCTAQDLLAFEGLTVAETAIRVGYESDIALSRAFKRHFDKNPGAVRRG